MVAPRRIPADPLPERVRYRPARPASDHGLGVGAVALATAALSVAVAVTLSCAIWLAATPRDGTATSSGSESGPSP